MSGPYQPGTIADTVEPLRELRPVKPDTDPLGAVPGLGDVFSASKELQAGDTGVFLQAEQRSRWNQVVDGLGLDARENPMEFSEGSGFGNSLPTMLRYGTRTRGEQEQRIAALVRAGRAKDAGFLAGVPDTPKELREWILAPMRERRSQARTVLGRDEGGVLSTVVQFGGAASVAMQDPANIVTLPIGGGGGSLGRIFAREALINSAIEATQLPGLKHNREQLGEELTAGEAAADVLVAGVAGGSLETAFAAGGRVLSPVAQRALDKLNEARVAMSVGTARPNSRVDVFTVLDNRELAALSRDLHGDGLTPDEKAAIAVLDRDQEMGEASPFEGGPDGDAAHSAGLVAALERLNADPASSAEAPTVIPPGNRRFEIEGPAVADDAQWSAVLGNEAGLGRRGEFLTSPKGAIGPAQVMPGTAPEAARLAGVAFDDHLYRTDRAYNEKLGRAYYDEQLRVFGDPAKAAAAYNAGPGSAKRGTGLRGAMDRAERAGEPGNWEAYLPAETRQYVADFRRRTGLAPGEGAGAPEVRGADAEDFDAELLAIAERRAMDDGGERSPGGEALIEPTPLLKRSMFGSDDDWADAQAALHRSLNDGGDEISSLTAGNGPPAREAAADGAGQPAPTFDRPRPDAIGPEPRRPRTFARAVSEVLHKQSRASGIAHRIDAEDAISHGVDADAIYHDANARYPTVKVQLARIFASSRAPLRSRARPVKLHKLDYLGDRLDPRDFGIEKPFGEHRLEPEEIGELLRASIEKSDAALDQADPNYDAYVEWQAKHDAAAEFEARYGERWAEMSDQELDAVDREFGDDLDVLVDRVLQASDRADIDPFDPRFWEETGHADPRRAATEGSGDAGSGAEGPGQSRGDAGEPGGRRAADAADGQGDRPGLAFTEVRIDDPALKAFDDPARSAADAHLENLMHDLFANVRADPALAERSFDLGDGQARPLREILAGFDAEDRELAELRACLAGGAG